MSGLFCVTSFRTRGCTPCAAVRLSLRTLQREQSAFSRQSPPQSLKIPYSFFYSGDNDYRNSVVSFCNTALLRVMFVGTQVDTISCKGADSVCCPLSCVFSLFFIMREGGEIPRLRAAQCAAAPRPAPFRCPPCQCRGIRCGCSGGSCGSISPSARPPRSAG